MANIYKLFSVNVDSQAAALSPPKVKVVVDAAMQWNVFNIERHWVTASHELNSRALLGVIDGTWTTGSMLWTLNCSNSSAGTF